MNDTTRRFLNAVLERVGESRVVELRLFPAIRQGGIESGIAVLAVQPQPEAPPVSEGVAIAEPTDDVAALDAAVAAEEATDDVEVPIEHPADVAMDEARAELEIDAEALHLVRETHAAPHEADGEPIGDTSDREAALAVATEGIAPPAGATDDEAGETEVELAPPIVADEASGDEPAESVALGDILALPAPDGADSVGGAAGPRRLEILCARYKLVFKGPDRGKWDLEIMHQADAPLDTLDRVIAGVVRRSGEESEPDRFSRESLRASLDAPAWAQSA